MADLEDQITEAWDALHDLDSVRNCCCPSCNYYAPDYDLRKDKPCEVTVAVERLIALGVQQSKAALVARLRKDSGDAYLKGCSEDDPDWITFSAAYDTAADLIEKEADCG